MNKESNNSRTHLVKQERPFLLLALAIFIIIQISALYFHEPWADEIQAWLLARDSTSLWELLSARLRYEASPGLWHTILWVASHFSTNLSVLNICSSIIATLSCALILFASPLPLWIRLFLPFSYYFGYQFSIVARSYCVANFAMLILALVYPHRLRRPWLYVLSLIAIANSIAHGILVVAAIALTDFPLKKEDWVKKSSLLKLTPIFIVGIVIALAQIMPLPKDVVLSAAPSISNWAIILPSLNDGLTGLWPFSLWILIASLWLFYKTKVLSLFLLPLSFVEIFFVTVYWNFWHSGILFMIWFFCLFQCYEIKHPATNKIWWKLSILVFLGVTVFHTANSIQHDTLFPFSGLKRVAQDIKHRNINPKDIACADYYSLMLRSYLPPVAGKPSYWKWAKSNNEFWTLENFIPTNISPNMQKKPNYPKFILCSDLYPVNPMKNLGYHIINYYPGSLFWRSWAVEPSGYILLERN